MYKYLTNKKRCARVRKKLKKVNTGRYRNVNTCIKSKVDWSNKQLRKWESMINLVLWIKFWSHMEF